MIGVLVVDDSALMRKVITQMLEEDKDIKVIGTARDGEEAVDKALKLKPDVITLDINMPKQDGITALQWILHYKICPVIMVSSLTKDGAVITFEALELGAFDYVEKPDGTVSKNMYLVKQELINKVKAAYYYSEKTKDIKRDVEEKKKQFDSQKKNLEKYKYSQIVSSSYLKYPAVVLGISTGGPQTLSEVLPLLPENLPAYFFVVQHMPSGFTASFASRLNKMCQMEVMESKAALKIEPGIIYLAKGGYHLSLYKKSDDEIILRHKTKPDNIIIPSVNITMEAVVDIFKDNTIGVIMTGMGDDGLEGMKKVKSAGGYGIAESEETAIVYGMPREVVEHGLADVVVPSYKVPEEIVKAVEMKLNMIKA